jgi:ribosome-associated protein
MPNSNREICGFQSGEFEEEYERPSKSQRKREMTALQKIGEQLVNESADRIKRTPMPENLREAILECQRIRNHEGRRRQLQYIGKIMRSLDEEAITTINRTIESWRGLSKADTLLMHALENQREKLLTDEKALTEFLHKYPQADIQQLRTLIRNAKKETAANKPLKAYREIYRLLKQIMTAPPLPEHENHESEE